MIIFHHVPKTAGSTLNHAIVNANPDVSCLIGAGGFRGRSDQDFSEIRYLGGHVTFEDTRKRGLHEGSIHVSLVREPLARIVSYFEMAYRDNDIFREEICGNDKWGQGFEVFYERFIVAERLTNIHCKYFSNFGRFYDAVVSIVNNFDAVGAVSRFEDFKDKLLTYFDRNNLNTPISFPIENRSSLGENHRDLIDEYLIEKINHDNHEDFLLYNWLVSKYDGLYTST